MYRSCGGLPKWSSSSLDSSSRQSVSSRHYRLCSNGREVGGRNRNLTAAWLWEERAKLSFLVLSMCIRRRWKEQQVSAEWVFTADEIVCRQG